MTNGPSGETRNDGSAAALAMTAWPSGGVRNIVVMSATLFVTLAGVTCWCRIMPNHFRSWGATETMVGLVGTLTIFLSSVTQIWGGKISDRRGRKKVIVFTTIIMSTCYAAVGLAPTWQWATVALGLLNLFGGIQWPAMLALATESSSEKRRGTAIAIIMAAQTAGAAAGPLIGSWVERTWPDNSWPILLVACASVYMLSAISRGLFLSETHFVSGAAPRSGKVAGSVDWRLILLPMVVGTLAMIGVFSTSEGPCLSFYLADELGYSKANIDMVFSASAGLALILTPLAGWATDRFGAVNTIRTGLFLWPALFVPFVVALWMDKPAHALWPGIEVPIFLGMALPGTLYGIAMTKLVATQTESSSRASHIGAFSLFNGFILCWIPLLAAWVYKNVNHTFPFAIAAAVWFGGFGLALWLGRGTAPAVERRPFVPRWFPFFSRRAA